MRERGGRSGKRKERLAGRKISRIDEMVSGQDDGLKRGERTEGLSAVIGSVGTRVAHCEELKKRGPGKRDQ